MPNNKLRSIDPNKRILPRQQVCPDCGRPSNIRPCVICGALSHNKQQRTEPVEELVADVRANQLPRELVAQKLRELERRGVVKRASVVSPPGKRRARA